MTRLTAASAAGFAGRPAPGFAGSAASPSDAHPGTGVAVDRPAPRVLRRPAILGEVVVVLLLLRAYDLIRAHAEVRAQAALRNGWDLLNAERLLHIDLEPAVNRWTSLHHAISLAASYWYQFFHITVTLLVLLWCYWRRPGSYRRARNALVLTNVFGLAFFLVYPAAPPRFLPGAGFIDAVANAGFGTSHGGPVTADQYGAFPSLHLAWAVWTAVVAARLVRPTWLRPALADLPADHRERGGRHRQPLRARRAGRHRNRTDQPWPSPTATPASRAYGRTGSARSLLRRLRAGLEALAGRRRRPELPTGLASTPPSRAAQPFGRPPVERQPATVGDQDGR